MAISLQKTVLFRKVRKLIKFCEIQNDILKSRIGSCCLNFDVVLEHKHDSLAYFFYVIWVRFMFYEV